MSAGNIAVKITKVKVTIEDVQRDIETIKQDLKYIQYPQLRAVADNMITAKRLKIARLKQDMTQLQKELLN